MQRPALEVADIFRDFGSAWLEANRGHVSHAQLKVMSAIEACRTAALGGYVAQGRVPLFQAVRYRAYGRGVAVLNGERLHRANAWAMVRRRAKAAGITTEVCNHTFRGTGITAYLENGGTLEKARQMAAHASTRTTQLYDRREDRVTLDEVVKINIRG